MRIIDWSADVCSSDLRQVHVVATAQEYGGFPFTYVRSEESYILDQVDRPVGHGCRRADLNDRDIAGHPFPERAILPNRPQLGRQPRLHGGCCNFYGFGHGPALAAIIVRNGDSTWNHQLFLTLNKTLKDPISSK